MRQAAAFLAVAALTAGAAPVVPPAPRVPDRPPTQAPSPPALDRAVANQATALVEQGVKAYDDGAFRQAIAHLEAALELDARNAKGLYYLANAHWRLDDYSRATETFRRLLVLDPLGPFAAEAREWLDAEGSFEILAARVPLRSGTPGPPRPAAATEVALPDGRTRVMIPAGWNRAVSEVVRGPQREEIHRVVFRKGPPGTGAASFVVEAQHRDAAPPAGGQKAIAGLGGIADRILGVEGIAEFQIKRSRAVTGGQELELEAASGAAGTVLVLVRGVWDGPSLLVTVIVAPQASWAAVQRELQPAVGSVRTGPATVSQRGPALPASSPGTPSPKPSPSFTPDVPTFYLPRPGETTLPPGLYPAPWATRAP